MTRRKRSQWRVTVAAATLLGSLLMLSLLCCPEGDCPFTHDVKQYSWAFDNWGMEVDGGANWDVPWETYRETFIGVPAMQQLAGLDAALFSEFYQTVFDPGHCFGISLLSGLIAEKGAHLGVCGPPIQHAGSLDKDEPEGGGPSSEHVKRAVKVLHGHQFNASFMERVGDIVADNRAADGNFAYEAFEDIIAQEGVALLTMFMPHKQAGHTMLAYRTEEQTGSRYVYFYDPNFSWADAKYRRWYEQDNNKIEIDPATGKWEYYRDWKPVQSCSQTPCGPCDYIYKPTRLWSGSPYEIQFSTGWLIASSPKEAGRPDGSIASLGAALYGKLKSLIVLSGDDVELVQIRDPSGRRLFLPGTHVVDADPTTGLPEAMPLIRSDGDGNSSSAFFIDLSCLTIEMEILADSSDYTVLVGGSDGVLKVNARDGDGTDKLRISGVGTSASSVELMNTAGASSYDVAFHHDVTPGIRVRSYEASSVTLPAGASAVIRVDTKSRAIDAAAFDGTVRFDTRFTDWQETSTSRELKNVTVQDGTPQVAWLADWENMSTADVLIGEGVLDPEELRP